MTFENNQTIRQLRSILYHWKLGPNCMINQNWAVPHYRQQMGSAPKHGRSGEGNHNNRRIFPQRAGRWFKKCVVGASIYT